MEKRITIRDMVDLLDYDRTGLRKVRIQDKTTLAYDILRTDSSILQYIEDKPVDAIDAFEGIIMLYIDFEEDRK